MIWQKGAANSINRPDHSGIHKHARVSLPSDIINHNTVNKTYMDNNLPVEQYRFCFTEIKMQKQFKYLYLLFTFCCLKLQKATIGELMTETVTSPPPTNT